LRCYKALAFMNIITHTYALNDKVLIKVLSIVILCRDALIQETLDATR